MIKLHTTVYRLRIKENGIYLVSTTEHLIGNDRCGLREFNARDAIWSQSDNNNNETVQDIIAEYIENQCRENGSLTPDAFTWKWFLEYSKDPDVLSPYTGEAAALLRELPKDGHTYVIYSEPERKLLAVNEKDEDLAPEECEAYGNILPAPLPEGTLVFNAHAAGAAINGSS